MNAFNNLRNLGQRVLNGAKAVSTINEAVSDAHSAFSGVSKDLPHTSMMGNPSGARGRDSYIPDPDDDDDDDDGISNVYYQPQTEVSDALLRNFRQKAKIKTQIIAGQIRKQYLWKRLLAKLIIQNKGDVQIANQYKDFTDDEIEQLPKNVQMIIRNQKHIRAIDNISIDATLEESCIEYFVMEFEQDYLNGIPLDLTNTNPVELMIMKYDQPFNEVLADIGIDWGLEAKPKVMAIVDKFFGKYFPKENKKEEKQEVVEETQNQPETFAELVEETDPPVKVQENPADTEIDDLPKSITLLSANWHNLFMTSQRMPNEDTPRWIEYLASKGLSIEDIADEKGYFTDIHHRLTFLKEFDRDWANRKVVVLDDDLDNSESENE